MAEYESQEREDGKSDIWEIEKRMIACPNFVLPERPILDRMFSLITMDTDIRQNTDDEDYIYLWLEQGVPDEAVENGEWNTIQDMVEDEQEYLSFVELYQYILKKR